MERLRASRGCVVSSRAQQSARSRDVGGEPGHQAFRCMNLCSHGDHIRLSRLPESADGCEDCLAEGGVWLHLRICLECGRVGCCDDSPHRHATAHAQATGHPIVRSLEPDEEWCWCYIDAIGLLVPEVTGSTKLPPPPLGT
jgi:Zn-finger in ubiquitin-hydrolases and other protein